MVKTCFPEIVTMFEENDIFFVDCQQILFLTALLEKAYQTVLETLFVSLKMKRTGGVKRQNLPPLEIRIFLQK